MDSEFDFSCKNHNLCLASTVWGVQNVQFLFLLPFLYSYSVLLYVYNSICLFLCSFCTASFERIWTKFGMWHPYTLRMVSGQLASAARARRLALCAPSTYAVTNGWVASSVGEFATGGRQVHRTERRMRELKSSLLQPCGQKPNRVYR